MTAPPRQHDRLVADWQRRLDRIKHELFRAHLHQAIWTAVRDEVKERRPDEDATFLVSYSNAYATSQMMLIRRLADTARSTDSLAGLVSAIASNAKVMTRSRYASAWATEDGPGGQEEGEAAWDRGFAEQPGEESLDVRPFIADLDRLDDELGKITRWATKVLAHLDPLLPEEVPRFSEIRDALTVLSHVAARCDLLLNRSTTIEWTPIVTGDWQAVFRPALFPLPPSVCAHPPLGGFT